MTNNSGAARSIFSVIELIDRVTGPITTINRSIDDFKNRLGGQQALVDKQTAAWSFFNNQMYGTPLIISRVQQQINDLTGYLQQNAAVLGLIGGEISMISYATKNFMVSSAIDASKEMAMMQALQKSYGAGAEEYVQHLKNLSGGVYDSGQMLSLVNQAHSVGVAYENMNSMVLGARGVARDTGKDQSEVLQDIVQGLSSGRMQTLASVGIKVDQTQAMRDYAAAAREVLAADSADGVVSDQQVQRKAMEMEVVKQLNQRYGDLDISQRTLSESMAAANTSWNEMGQSLGKGLIPTLDALANITTTITKAINMVPGPVLAVIGVLVTIAAIIGIVSGLILVQNGLVAVLGGEYATLGGVVGIVSTGYVKMITTLTALLAPESFAIVTTGGLTASLWQLVAASAALLLEWLPIIVAIGALAAAILYLQDIMTHGWENSELRKELQKIKDLMDAIWNNPIGKAFMVATMLFNPLGTAYVGYKTAGEVSQAANVAGRSPVFSQKAATPASNRQVQINVTMPGMKVGGISDPNELKPYISQGVKEGLDSYDRAKSRELRSVGA